MGAVGILNSILKPVFGSDEDSTLIHDDLKSDLNEDYQNGEGAPVETTNPLGYNLDYVSAFYMVIQGIIGTGIFLTPASILNSIGSVGASYVLWVAGFIIAIFEVLVYVEFATYFKKRNGGDVAYLEQAFPKPNYLIPTAYAAVTVILSFSVSSAVAFGTYVLAASGTESTTWKQRGIGVAILSFAALLTAVHPKASLKLANLLGFVKMVFLAFIIITGFVVLGGGTKVQNPHAIFKDSWKGSTTDGNAIANAIIKVSFSYGGTNYVFNLVGESNPKKTKNLFRFFIPAVVTLVFFIYILLITTFYAGSGGIEQIKKSGVLIASLFFTNVFGTRAATQALDVLVALSALGHLLAVFVGHSRALRECGRQGVLPWPRLWTTTKPLGTPLLPVLITYIVNLIVLLAPPAGDAYNFIVDVGSYSNYFFKVLLFVGLILLRRQRKQAGLGPQGWWVPLPIIIIGMLFYVFVIAMAWVPPKGGSLKGSDVSFFYATYAITTIGIYLACFVYYFVWAKILPKIGDYRHRTAFYDLPNGERGHTVVKVKRDEIEKWDSEHDSTGRLIGLHNSDDSLEIESVENISYAVSSEKKA
ncbi:amino acid permease-domain-containing protein [Scheffersomyces xylosifermentans]|uniref:amino acid permease-domain-containing protein n=1 Tax=Scheffersomyces xylosifermentans TaxID=1304137 RepID=UPI00315DC242